MRSWSKWVIFSREDEVFHRGRAAQADLQRILVVGDLDALVGGQFALGIVDTHAVERAVQRILADIGLAVAGLARGDVFGGRAGGGQRRVRHEHFAAVGGVGGQAVFEALGRVERTVGGQFLVFAGFFQQALALRRVGAQAFRWIRVGRTADGAQDRSRAVERTVGRERGVVGIVLVRGHASPRWVVMGKTHTVRLCLLEKCLAPG
jgi:hypothetical protein